MSRRYPKICQCRPSCGKVLSLSQRCDLGYGTLKKIFTLTLPQDLFFGVLSGKTLLLTLIAPWDTAKGRDAAVENVYFEKQANLPSPFVTDIRNVKSVVGLVPVGKRWGIVDRGGLDRFAETEIPEVDSDSDSGIGK